MRPTAFKAIITALPLLSTLPTVAAQTSGLKTMVSKGCFSSAGGLTDLGPYTYQSPGYCQQQCVNQNKPVMGTTKGSNCWCGDLLPDPGSKVSDTQCSSTCDGYDKDICGGPNAWSIQLTGIDNNVGSEQSSSSDSNAHANLDTNSNPNPNSNQKAAAPSSKSTPQPTTTLKEPPSVVTKASTIVVTAAGQSTPQQTVITTTETPPPSGGPNKAGIAAGVVVGIVALSAIIGGAFLFFRNRKKRALEENYRRNLVESYGPKPPHSSAGSTSDSRLEPSVMMQRRQSDGSIADNQDYSRRILKITNPDGT
ncbi:Protein SLG1 [Lecanora helva]